jgi:hypothetical protein
LPLAVGPAMRIAATRVKGIVALDQKRLLFRRYEKAGS